jgi:trans-aconitate 2-methyltransferase
MSLRNYTFGDSGEASIRLRRLADLYEPETRALLGRSRIPPLRVAIDLGCGPGWSTELVHEVLKPSRTVGLDASEHFIAEARRNRGTELEFHVQDVIREPFPVARPDVLFCRFLLTHIAPPGEALAAWADAAAPGAVLLIHETESLETENPAIDRYYELVGLLQDHYGQALYIGGLLEAFVEQSGWNIVESKRLMLQKPARKMAELHLSNLRTWRHDEYAKKAFDAAEIDGLERSLEQIVRGERNAGVVVNAARQIVARRA